MFQSLRMQKTVYYCCYFGEIIIPGKALIIIVTPKKFPEKALRHDPCLVL